MFSDQGKTYGRVCRYWGVDPAGGFGDDVMAHAVRTGLLIALADEPEGEPEPAVQGKIVTDLEELMRAYE